MALDERLRRELERAGRPADPSGIYEELIRRRERRHIVRKVESGVLAIAVVAVSVAGVYGLSRVFGEDAERDDAARALSNGEIVFSIPLETGIDALMAVLPDGTGLRRLTPEGRANYRSPDVSPDGRTIVVVHEVRRFEPPSPSVLATIPIEGGSPTWLTDPGFFVDPTWSPDGNRIAFAGSPGGPYGIYILDLATAESRLVPGTDEINVGHPTWSPDGEHIAFAAWDAAEPERWDIYSVRLDGSELTNLTNTREESETMPAWSWTNDRIAFVAGGPAEGGLASIAADGTDRQRLWDGENAPHDPVWSPDGERLAFWVDTGQVFTVREDGTDLQPVASAMGAPAWAVVADGAPAMPTPTQTSTMTPPPVGKDIGLGFPVCNVTSVRGEFAPGVDGVDGKAYVATKAGDTACPDLGDGMQVVAVDVTGDGLADTSYGPLECEQWCTAYATPDVDGDGTDELLMQNVEFSIIGLTLFEVEPGDGGAAIGPVTLAPPGDPGGGFEPGAIPQLWLGGDGFSIDTLRCGTLDGPTGPGFVYTTAESLPHDSPNAEWHAHEVTFVLRDWELHIVNVREFTEPVVPGPPSFQSGKTLCGSNLGPSQG